MHTYVELAIGLFGAVWLDGGLQERAVGARGANATGFRTCTRGGDGYRGNGTARSCPQTRSQAG